MDFSEVSVGPMVRPSCPEQVAIVKHASVSRQSELTQCAWALQCMSKTDDPMKCRPLRDDYLECLHHRKEVRPIAWRPHLKE